MSQEFPTASLDITEDIHILHSAYVYICYCILKAKTYNWLPNTHSNSNNSKQKATGHVPSLANGHLTGSNALSVCKIPTAASDKKQKQKNEKILTLDWLWGRPETDPTKACFKSYRWFGKGPKTDAFTKLGKLTIIAAGAPRTVLDRHF